MQFWVLSGSLENWDRGISDKIWGVREGLKFWWQELSKEDKLFFYVTSPISGVIGVGKVTNKFEQKEPLWPDEIRSNKTIYPYRFEFEVEYVIPKPEWKEKAISLKNINLNYRAGLNIAKNKEEIKKLAEKIEENWKIKIEELETKVKTAVPIRKKNLHEDAKEKIYEVGRMRGFISEKEYSMDGRRLDVVWRVSGVKGGVPKYVFEVEISGGLFRALAKLKHAWDLWAYPKLYIITTKDKFVEIENLISGTFHEIRDALKIIDVEKIDDYYKIVSKESEFNKEFDF